MAFAVSAMMGVCLPLTASCLANGLGRLIAVHHRHLAVHEYGGIVLAIHRLKGIESVFCDIRAIADAARAAR